MLSADELQFSYQGQNVMTFPDLTLGEQDKRAILGGSGSGKTTLLLILAGLLKPSAGKVRIDGRDIYGLSDAQRDAFRARSLGLIFQENIFLQALTVEENIGLSGKFAGNKIPKARIEALADQLNIHQHLTKKPRQLSVGQLQRASIVRALVHSPKIVLADEPTSALDDENCEQVINLLMECTVEQGASLIVVTHDGRLKSHFDEQHIYNLGKA